MFSVSKEFFIEVFHPVCKAQCFLFFIRCFVFSFSTILNQTRRGGHNWSYDINRRKVHPAILCGFPHPPNCTHGNRSLVCLHTGQLPLFVTAQLLGQHPVSRASRPHSVLQLDTDGYIDLQR